jgi:hypothetical protein
LRAFSVRQPWAWAIARGHKPVLNQALYTRYRGPVAIYASFRVDLGSFESRLIRETASSGWDSGDPVAAIGGIVAVVDLAGVCAAATSGGPCCCGDWAALGAYHWRLEDPRPLRWPVLALGQPGLWELPPGVAAGVARLLPGEAATRPTATRGAAAVAAELDSVDYGTDCPAAPARPAGRARPRRPRRSGASDAAGDHLKPAGS